MNFQSAMNSLAVGFKTARQEWLTAYAVPYLTQANKPRYESQTRTKGYGTTPAATSPPAPYTPSANDMTALDWVVVNPATFTVLGGVPIGAKFHEAMKTLAEGTAAVSRQAWITPSSMPYVTYSTRQQIEIQTRSKSPTTPPTYVTTDPAPYSPSQADLAASDWAIVNPEQL